MTDFDAVLEEARLGRVCAECSAPLEIWHGRFCSPTCRYRFRDRRKYAEDKERVKARSRAYYQRNREAVLARLAEKRAGSKAPSLTHCSECGIELVGRLRFTCGTNRCREARYKRTNPEAYAAREARKAERRRAKRREGEPAE